MEVSFRFPWVDAEECDCWITLLYSKTIVNVVRNCQSESVCHLVVLTLSWPHGLEPIRLLCPWNSPGRNTGVGCYSPLQGIFLTQGSNLGPLHSRQILYHLEPPWKINCHTVFQGSCTHLHSHQQWIRAPVAPHPPQHLVLTVFCISVVLIGVCWVSLSFQFLPLSTSPPPPFLTTTNLFRKSHGIWAWELSSRWHKLSNIRHMIERKTEKGLPQVTWEPWEEE